MVHDGYDRAASVLAKEGICFVQPLFQVGTTRVNKHRAGLGLLYVYFEVYDLICYDLKSATDHRVPLLLPSGGQQYPTACTKKNTRDTCTTDP